MKYYKDSQNKVYAYESDGSQDEYIDPELVPITQEAANLLLIEPPTIPSRVTMRQARLALLGAGLLDDVLAAIEAMPSPQKEEAQIEWEYSQEVQRDKALVLALAPALGLDDAALDQLFIQAATL